MQYIILVWKASDPSDRYWMIRKNEQEAIALAKDYNTHGFKAEIYPHNFIDNPCFWVA